MIDVNSQVHNIEELLLTCSRSITDPDRITKEMNRILSVINDHNLDQKYIVAGCETLSLLASGFIRCGFDSFIKTYSYKTGILYDEFGFANKDELVQYCEFCVIYGDECLSKMEIHIMRQLEVENRMTKDEIRNLNFHKYKNQITVQEQITDYIKLLLLVNSLKEFFKDYYNGLN